METESQHPNRVSAPRTAVRSSAATMNSENSLVLMSDEPQPTKSGVKTGYQEVNGHISQIPGLSPTIRTLPEEKTRGRRAGVLQSDSDYIKLAKQGGHKGLLWHEESIIPKPDSYKPSDGFGSASEDRPSPINSQEKKNPGAFLPLEAPFGGDNLSAWERDHSSGDVKEKDNVHVHDTQMEKLQTSSYHPTSKFKRLVFDKKPAPVDMSKLLSFGYAEDNTPVQ